VGHVQKKIYVSRKTKKETTAWQARYWDPNRKQHTKRFDRKVDAENWLKNNEGNVVRGQWIDPDGGKELFRDYAQAWLEGVVDVSERTSINIEGRIRNHAIPHFGNSQLGVIRPQDVRAFVSHLTRTHEPETVKSIYRTTAQVFAQAVIESKIAKTPCIGIKLPRKREKSEMHFLTPEQIRDLGETITGHYRVLIYTAAYSGLRAGELVALRVEDLDLGELGGTISVIKSASEVRGQLKVGTTKTGRSRVVTIPRFLSVMLTEHLDGRETGFVFTAAEGGPIRHRNFMRRHFDPAITKAREIAAAEERDLDAVPEDLRFHDLRHTCAALLIAQGRHMEEVKDHLGHASIRTTSDVYGHLFKDAKVAIADALEAMFQDATVAARDERGTKSVSGMFRRVQ
jgi:integrase